MTDDTRVQQIVEEILESDQSPEAVCRGDTELLSAVRKRLKQFRALNDHLEVLFPSDATSGGNGSVASSTGPANNGSLSPERIGDYRIVREIGRGGMGIVYEAVHESLSRRVALKVFTRRGGADPVQLERFRREARSAALLHHTSIVPVFDVGEVDGTHFYAMQYIEGQGLNLVLAELVRATGNAKTVGGKIAGGMKHQTDSSTYQDYYRNVARIGALSAEALAYAHGQKILHRDIKPANILLATDGGVWICDFGLAKTENDNLTHTGDLVGTFRYMAPERLSGQTDARSDIYSLGLTLYELLTLKPAFDESDRGRLIRQISEHEPPRPSQLDRRVPRDLETIVLKAIAKDPRSRYQTAQGLADDLRRYMADRPIQARRSSTTEQLWRWCRRNPVAASFGSLALTAIAALAVISTISAISFRTQRNELKLSNEQLQQAELDTRLEIGKSLLAQGASNLRTGLAGRREESLKLFRQANEILQSDPRGQAFLPELRDQVICAAGLTDLHTISERTVAPEFDISVDSRLERYAVGLRGSPEVVIRSMADDRELMRLPGAAKPYWHCWPRFSPDGRYLMAAYHIRNEAPVQLDVWRLDPREKVLSLSVPTSAVAFHPNGRTLAAFAAPGELSVWDLIDRTEKRRIAHTSDPAFMAFDPSGRRLAILAGDRDRQNRLQKSQLRILDLESGDDIASWTENVGNNVLCWSSDGRFLAMGAATGETFVRDVTDAKFVNVLRGHVSTVIECQFVRNGHLLATSSWDGTTRLWDAVTGECMAVSSGRLRGDFSADRRIAFSRGPGLGIWELPEVEELRSLSVAYLPPHDQSVGEFRTVFAAEFSPDGRLIAVGSAGGVQLFDAITGEIRARLDCPECYVVLFDSNGSALITYDDIGLRRWPIRADAAGGGWSVGAAQMLLAPEFSSLRNRRAAWLPGTSVIAISDVQRSSIRLLDISQSGSVPLQLHEFPAKYRRITTVSISPDGRWMATGGWKDGGIQVWNLPEKRFERLLEPGDGSGNPIFRTTFAPDGRLTSATYSDTKVGYYAFQPGTWDRSVISFAPEAPILGPPAFSRDGTLMAMSVSPNKVRLANSADGQPLANLVSLDRLDAFPLAFSPDGARLAVATNRGAVQIWDVKKMRQRLAKWNLDWNATPAVGANAANSAP